MVKTITSYDRKLAAIFQDIYDRSIDFGAHPNPRSAFTAMKLEENGKERSIQVLALTTEDKVILHAMKSAGQAGLAALFVLQHIFKAKFENRGIREEMDALRQVGL